MQRVAPFLLALIFLLVSAGYYLAFLSEDVALKSDAQQVINSAEQQRVQVALTFTPGTQAAVHFTNARQTEFIYGGMHYDVVRKFSSNSSVTYVCYADTRESRFCNQFNRQNDEGTPASSSQKIQFKSVDWLFHSVEKTRLGYLTGYSSSTLTPKISIAEQEVTSPPPRA